LWVALLTNQVEWKTKTKRTKIPQITNGQGSQRFLGRRGTSKGCLAQETAGSSKAWGHDVYRRHQRVSDSVQHPQAKRGCV